MGARVRHASRVLPKTQRLSPSRTPAQPGARALLSLSNSSLAALLHAVLTACNNSPRTAQNRGLFNKECTHIREASAEAEAKILAEVKAEAERVEQARQQEGK